ncbi:hypothetical protein EJB05_48758, partial [Eragrostis curvula]
MSAVNRREHASAIPPAACGATASASGGAAAGGGGGGRSQATEKRKPPFRPAPDDTKPVLRDPVYPLSPLASPISSFFDHRGVTRVRIWLLTCADLAVGPRGGRAGRATATALPLTPGAAVLNSDGWIQSEQDDKPFL